MNAAIDLGNSRLKILRSDGTYAAWHTNAIDWREVERILAPATRIIMSSVNPQVEPHLRELLSGNPEVVDVRHCIAAGKLPIVVEANGIGPDRVLGVLGALHHRTPPFVVVDLGTAMTATALDREYHVTGGYIVPGIELQYRILRQSFPQLPVPSPGKEWGYEPGRTTESAIAAGLSVLTTYFLAGVHASIAAYYRVQRVFLFVTGGYCHQLPTGIFEHVGVEGEICPHLVLHGALSLLEE